MIIKESDKANHLEEESDAESRVAVWACEHARTPEISRLGITFDPVSGLTIIDSKRAIRGSESGLIMQTMTDTNQNDGLLATGMCLRKLDGTLHKFPKIEEISPEWIMYCINKFKDYRSISKMLGLNERNFDELSSSDGPFVRVVDDQIILNLFGELNCELIPMYDSKNMLIECDCYSKAMRCVCTLKIFKFVASPRIFGFRFRRERPGVALLTNKPYSINNPCIIDTDIETALANRGMAWLNDSGDLAKMDWDVLRNHYPAIVWHDKKNPIESNNHLKHVLSIVAIAKRNDINLNVIKASCDKGQGEEASEVSHLGLKELRHEAVKRGIDLPEPLRESKYLIHLDLNSLIETSRLPDYWSKGAVTCFYFKDSHVNSGDILKQILSKTKEEINVMLLIPKSKEIEVGRAVYEHPPRRGLVCADIDILDNFSELKKLASEHKIDLILCCNEVDDCNTAQEYQEKALGASLDLLLSIGIISNTKPNNSASRLIFDNMYCAEKCDEPCGLSLIDKPEMTKSYQTRN